MRKPASTVAAGYRILVVDDNPADIELIRHQLRRSTRRCTILTATNREEFLSRLQTDPDIILTDYNMPSFGATDVMSAAMKSDDNIPVIIISGSLGEDAAVAAMRHGAADYLLKDRLGRLNSAIEAAVQHRELRRARRNAELALKKSEDLYRSMFDRNPLPMWLFDLETLRFIAVNQAAINHYGYSETEFLNMTVRDIRPVNERPALERALAELSPHKKSAATTRHRKKSGEIIDVEVTIDEFSLGGVACRLVLVNDISLRLKATAALLASEQRIRGMFAKAAVGISITDPAGIFVDANPAFCRIVGYSAEELANLDMHALVHPDDQPAKRTQLDRLVAGEIDSFIIEKRYLVKGGGIAWVRASLSVIRSLTGSVQHIISVSENITERKLAEDLLHQSQALVSIAGRMAKLGGWAVDVPSTKVTWSEEIRRIYEVPDDDAIDFEKAIHYYAPEWQPVISGAFQECVNAGRPFDLELELVAHGGQRKWLRAVGESVRDASGHIVRAQGALQDISDRKKAEESLRASEMRFRELADNIEDVFYNYDIKANRMLYISPAYERVWGRSCESLYADPLSFVAAIHPADRIKAEESLRAQAAGRTTEKEYRVLLPDGTVRWVRDQSYPVLDKDKTAARVVGIARDITDRKEAATRLSDQAALLDKAQDAIVVHGLDHRVSYWNKSAEQLYGWPAAEARGKSVLEFLYDDPTRLMEAIKQVLQNGEWRGELEQVTRDRRKLQIEARWTLVRDEHDCPRSILAINTDVTERKSLEQQMLRAQRMESIGTLAGGIAHDLNNVLAPIMMGIGLIRRIETRPEVIKTISLIEKSTQRGANLVNQVLSFARGVEGAHVPMEIRHLVGEVELMIESTFPKNITVNVSIPADLWPISCDPTQINQVLLNLCVNARDAMSPAGGQLNIAASNIEVDAQFAAMNHGIAPGRYAAVEITDTGCGIPKEHLDKIFDPFFTTKPLGKGTGLGLSSAHGIVRSHGGFINVHSESGIGTTFRVILPARPERSPAGQDETGCLAMPRGSGQLVLVVDDESTILSITRQTLETFGYKVLTAEDGAQAIGLFASQQANISVVVTDMMMPIMDGVTLIHALRRLCPTVRVIGASGVGKNISAARVSVPEIKLYLQKPYTAAALLSAIQTALEDKD